MSLIFELNGCRLEFVRGNIVEMNTEAIVNAANQHLVLGAGVAGAIASAGGPVIQKECDKIGGTQVGNAVVTGGGNLKARYVIHAVGPIMGEGDEDLKLASATRNSLQRAREMDIGSIAFPAISTGIFRFPVDRCAQLMLAETIAFINREKWPRRVVFCLYTDEILQVFLNEAKKRLG